MFLQVLELPGLGTFSTASLGLSHPRAPDSYAGLHRSIRSDTMGHVNTFLRSEEFDAWLSGLKDKIGRARIVHRIRSAEHGNFGDCEPVGNGVSKCASMLVQATEPISPGAQRRSICFSWAATSPRRSVTSNAP